MKKKTFFKFFTIAISAIFLLAFTTASAINYSVDNTQDIIQTQTGNDALLKCPVVNIDQVNMNATVESFTIEKGATMMVCTEELVDIAAPNILTQEGILTTTGDYDAMIAVINNNKQNESSDVIMNLKLLRLQLSNHNETTIPVILLINNQEGVTNIPITAVVSVSTSTDNLMENTKSTLLSMTSTNANELKIANTLQNVG